MVTNLWSILERAAASSASCIFEIETENGAKTEVLTYQELYDLAVARATLLRAALGAARAEINLQVILLHFDDVKDYIQWFWTVVAAGLTPAILPKSAGTLRRYGDLSGHLYEAEYLDHISVIMDRPVLLTNRAMADGFCDGVAANLGFVRTGNLDLLTVEAVMLRSLHLDRVVSQNQQVKQDQSVIMLTSGSTGRPKAVEISFNQMIAALVGKSMALATTSKDTFLSWVSFEHVANLLEIHLQAMFLCAHQVQVSAEYVCSRPIRFMKLLSSYRISYSFAPHSFLEQVLRDVKEARTAPEIDLSCLRRLISGGEVNVLKGVRQISRAFSELGAQPTVIVPGFGMTETCAGCIYNTNLSLDGETERLEFAPLGIACPGLELRIVSEGGVVTSRNEVGILQLAGDQVFKQYLGDADATASAFVDDKWFVTGDEAFIDHHGYLNILGRDKEKINVNGVTYHPQAIELAIERESEQIGLTPSWTVVFSTRAPESPREKVCVLYQTVEDTLDVDALQLAKTVIANVVKDVIGLAPQCVVGLPPGFMQKSVLGKLSRSKLRRDLESGVFDHFKLDQNTASDKSLITLDASSTELMICQEIKSLNIVGRPDELGTGNDILLLGLSSLDLFRLLRRVHDKCGFSDRVNINTLLKHSTIRDFANAIDASKLSSKDDEYEAVVCLHGQGDRTPLFLVHPGSGDVLAFLALAQFFHDRPVYGFRARGLSPGTGYFRSLRDMADEYTRRLVQIQPQGPYVVAGYSLGSSIAFEIARRLEDRGAEVAFCGAFDSPPSIAGLVKNIDSTDVVYNVAYFLKLIDEKTMRQLSNQPHTTAEEAIQLVFSKASKVRVAALALSPERLGDIAAVTHAFGRAAVDYEPQGSVAQMDVFWTEPLPWVCDCKPWREEMLSRWEEHSRKPPIYHQCGGKHATMLDSEYADDLALTMQGVLYARGV